MERYPDSKGTIPDGDQPGEQNVWQPEWKQEVPACDPPRNEERDAPYIEVYPDVWQVKSHSAGDGDR